MSLKENKLQNKQAFNIDKLAVIRTSYICLLIAKFKTSTILTVNEPFILKASYAVKSKKFFYWATPKSYNVFFVAVNLRKVRNDHLRKQKYTVK